MARRASHRESDIVANLQHLLTVSLERTKLLHVVRETRLLLEAGLSRDHGLCVGEVS